MTYECMFIDGTNLLHRSWHVAGVANRPTMDVFESVLHTIRNLTMPRYAAVAFDDITCFRHAFYPPYKAGRAIKPPGLIDILHECRAMPVICRMQVVLAADHEADDIVATYAYATSLMRRKTLVVSSDRDTYALVNRYTSVARPTNGGGYTYVGPVEVMGELGVTPAGVPAYKALVGDAGDNIPGVPGIGAKRAAALVKAHGPEIADILVKLTCPPARGSLEDAQSAGINAYDLVRLRYNAPVNRRLETLTVL